MVRSHLNKFLADHPKVQIVFLFICFMLFSSYIVFFSLDLINLFDTSIRNYELIESDDSIITLDSYELVNKDLITSDKRYEDISIVFYGICTEDDSVYFSVDSNTLIQSLPNNFGVSFLLSSNALIVFISLLLFTFVLFMVRNSDTLRLQYTNTGTCAYFLVITVVFFLLMVVAFLGLC